jgi:hypothetical protein
MILDEQDAKGNGHQVVMVKMNEVVCLTQCISSESVSEKRLHANETIERSYPFHSFFLSRFPGG